MIVWFFHVKVGHRQTPIPKPPTDVGGFLHICRFCRFSGKIGITGVGITNIGVVMCRCLWSIRASWYWNRKYLPCCYSCTKVPKVTVNRLQYLKSNGICVNMSYAFIWNRAVFYCRCGSVGGVGKTVLQTARLIQSNTL